MTLTLYEVTIPIFIKKLNILAKLLQKGVEHAQDAGNAVTEESLVDARLIGDMKGLGYQSVAVRVGKIEPVPMEDNEKTFEELQERIRKTIKVLESVKAEEFNKYEDSEVVVPTRDGEHRLIAKSYVLDYAIPNFYFHFVTAYDILRAQGVQIGKMNYLGRE